MVAKQPFRRSLMAVSFAGCLVFCSWLLLLAAAPADRVYAGSSVLGARGETGAHGRAANGITGTVEAYLPVVASPPQPLLRVTATSHHVCALRADGKVLCWGAQDFPAAEPPELYGIFTTPHLVAGLEEPLLRLAAGGGVISTRHGNIVHFGSTCAVTAAGALQCWGSAYSLKDAPVTMLPAGVADTSVGAAHACALMNDGGVRCWGSNRSGALGDGTDQNRETPVSVAGLRGPVRAITVGEVACLDCLPWASTYLGHSCAALQTGEVYCWGDNRDGQLGSDLQGTDAFSLTPIKVQGLKARALDINTYYTETCALLEGGAVACWGGSFGAQPQVIQGISAPIVALYDGCGVDTAGRLLCWWADPAIAVVANNIPVSVTSYASAGGMATCVTGADGSAWCSGSNDFGQLGNGEGGMDRPDPVQVFGLGYSGKEVTAGEHFACARLQNDTVWCWGSNSGGQLGDGSQAASSVPRLTQNLPPVVQVSAGREHVCARTAAGVVSCWGANDRGQVGSGVPATTLPFTVTGVADVAAVAAGGDHTCAVLQGGELRCWGDNRYGQLGGADEGSAQPRGVIGLSGPVNVVGAGIEHTCALLANGAVQCWGGNRLGQLGIGTATISETQPLTVTGLASGVTGLAVGGYHTCALLAGSSGEVKCWGAKAGSYFAQEAIEFYTMPHTALGIHQVVALAANGKTYDYFPEFNGMPPPHIWAVDAGTCALTAEGAVVCWGMGHEDMARTPEGLAANVTSVAVGAESACAVTDTGSVRCWGRNEAGALGNGGAWSDLPVQVKVE